MYLLEGEKMKALYKIKIEFNIIKECEEVGEIKSDLEFAEDIAQFVCDELVNGGALGSYDIIESKMDVK